MSSELRSYYPQQFERRAQATSRYQEEGPIRKTYESTFRTKRRQQMEEDSHLNKTSKILTYARSNKSVIFFKCLKKTTTPETIRQVFCQFGKLAYVQLPYNKVKKRNIGYGYVVFYHPSIGKYLVEQVKAINIDGKLINISSFVERQHMLKTEAAPPVHWTSAVPCETAVGQGKEDVLGPDDEDDCKSFKQEEDQSTRSDVDSILYLSGSSCQYHSVKPNEKLYSLIERDSGLKHDPENLMFRRPRRRTQRTLTRHPI